MPLDWTGWTQEGDFEPLIVANAKASPRVDLAPRQALARIPALARSAQHLAAGLITQAERNRLVQNLKPVMPYNSLPAPATAAEIREAVDAAKRDRVLAVAQEAANGDLVAARLDIPAFTRRGVWAISVHASSSARRIGKSLGYEAVIALDEVHLEVHQGAAWKIACGGAKAPMAAMVGGYDRLPLEDIVREARQAIVSPEWVQIGMDPERHSYFYDRMTHQPVVGASRVLQVGPLALARDPRYGDPAAYRY